MFMKRFSTMILLVATFGFPISVLAEKIDFKCMAGRGYICYFSTVNEAHADIRAWIMRPKEVNRISNLKLGDKYYVASAPVYANPQICAIVRSRGGWCYLKTINPGINN